MSNSPFDDLPLEYAAWFDGEGSLPFAIEVQAFKGLLPSLPKPWLEIGIGSGRTMGPKNLLTPAIHCLWPP
jgi:hypothetical protein